jgi:pimeloyl-ACP methyl ester carboxylesterase
LKASGANKPWFEAQKSSTRRRQSGIPFTFPTILFLLGLMPLWICSCSLMGLKSHITRMEQYGTVTIQVSPPPETNAPTYALAWTAGADGELESAGCQRLRADGLASFTLLTNRTYSVGAFTDENGNGAYDAGEPAGRVTNVTPHGLGDPHARAKIFRFALTREHGLPPDTVIEIPKTNAALGQVLEIAMGDVVPLEDARFSSQTGSGGMWRPFDFLNQNVAGIYFTEPYDPKRIPVIFVYGIGGSPQDWSYILGHFDRSRYQLWFFHYPSGMRLSRVAGAFAGGLEILKARHGFVQCDIVAHSMGGLVSGEAIRDVVAEDGDVDFISKFVSISTPWGGHKAASLGVRYLKKPVPSWLDVVPDSDFLESLYANPLPEGTQFDLIYGEIPKSSGAPGKDDGVVTVESELDSRITRNAVSVNRLPYGHVQILSRPETLKLVETFLDQ